MLVLPRCCAVQVSTLRASNADPRKFYVNSGMKVVSLRAESKEDLWVWMSALRERCAAALACWQRAT